VEDQEQLFSESNYDTYLSAADLYFLMKDYRNARNGYDMALLCRPFEEYPRQRIAECEQKLEAERKDGRSVRFFGEMRGEQYWTGKEYVYGSDGRLLRIRVYMEGRYRFDLPPDSGG